MAVSVPFYWFIPPLQLYTLTSLLKLKSRKLLALREGRRFEGRVDVG